jgi:hypothetical protein
MIEWKTGNNLYEGLGWRPVRLNVLDDIRFWICDTVPISPAACGGQRRAITSVLRDWWNSDASPASRYSNKDPFTSGHSLRLRDWGEGKIYRIWILISVLHDTLRISEKLQRSCRTLSEEQCSWNVCIILSYQTVNTQRQYSWLNCFVSVKKIYIGSFLCSAKTFKMFLLPTGFCHIGRKCFL